jgi:hypothetical protein
MKEKDGHLIQTFRKRRDEYRIPLRKESWEKLETELLSRSVFHRRMYRLASAAAAILVCLALSLPFLIKKDRTGMVADTPGNSSETTAPHKENDSQMQERQTISVIASASVSFSAGRKIPDKIPDEIAAAEAKEETSPVVIPDELPEETASFTGPQQEKRMAVNYTPPAVKNKQRSKWTFGLSAGSNNAKGSAYEQTGKEPGIVVPPYYTAPDDETGIDTDIDGGEEEEEEPGTKAFVPFRTESREDLTRYNYHHRLPISIGLSVQKKLSNHFGLESGLTYTYLYSDISKEGVSGYIGNQKLHYLGIPVKASWLIYNQKRFSVYLSGGTLVEYCISAGRKTDNQNERLDFNRFQVSLNAAAGMQFVLAKPVSLFVEPGVSYYTDNGGGIETIRTDNPLMFNLQAGVRFTY